MEALWLLGNDADEAIKDTGINRGAPVDDRHDARSDRKSADAANTNIVRLTEWNRVNTTCIYLHL